MTPICLRYKNNLKLVMKACHISSISWEYDCLNRLAWRSQHHSTVIEFEKETRISAVK